MTNLLSANETFGSHSADSTWQSGALPRPCSPADTNDTITSGKASISAAETISGSVDETQRPLRQLAQLETLCSDFQDPDPLAAPLPTGAQRYEPNEMLGQGGCAIVIRAYDRQLQRDVVIKQIPANVAGSEEIRKRFWHEALISGGLEHPGIAPVYEAGVDAATGESFYAMK